MKKTFGKGFFLGMALSALVVATGVTAFAAVRGITVDDGVQLVLNGTAFAPKDSEGAALPIFNHRGSTYVPLQEFAAATGLRVSYKADTATATVTGRADTAVPDNTGYIGVEKAKQIALAHAGQAANRVTFIAAKLDTENGTVIYEVEFYSSASEYDYEIDAQTGAVLSYDYDAEFYAPPAKAPAQTGTIGEAKAKELALAKAPGATVVKCELDTDDGRKVYELELRDGTTEYDCEIDAATGAILKWEMD